MFMDIESKLCDNFVKFLCHSLGACFEPYNDFTSLHTLFSCSSPMNPSGWSILISCSRYPLRNAIFTSIWWINILWMEANTKRTLIVEILMIGELVTKKSIPFCYVKPLASNLPFYLPTVPSGLGFLLKIHLHPTDLHLKKDQWESKCFSL